jgi:hypothetical protein
LSDRYKQVAKAPERMRPDRVAVIRGDEPTVGPFARKHVKVIGLKIDHAFEKLPL